MARPKPRRPVPVEMVARGLAHDLDEARRLVADGVVVRNGGPVLSEATLVAPADALSVARPARFASRAGEKLAGALDRFALDVAGRRALDIGASTGGFVDCLLQRGAATVVAVDVGPSALLPRIAEDPRVEVRDRTDARTLDPATIGTFGVVTTDASMISLVELLPAVGRTLDAGGEAVLLVKPQYEADFVTVRRAGGIVRDPVTWREVLGSVLAALPAAGLAARGLAPSSLRGGKGNVEFVLHAVAGDVEGDVETLADAAVAELAPAVRGAGPAADEGGDPACWSGRVPDQRDL